MRHEPRFAYKRLIGPSHSCAGLPGASLQAGSGVSQFRPNVYAFMKGLSESGLQGRATDMASVGTAPLLSAMMRRQNPPSTRL